MAAQLAFMLSLALLAVTGLAFAASIGLVILSTAWTARGLQRGERTAGASRGPRRRGPRARRAARGPGAARKRPPRGPLARRST